MHRDLFYEPKAVRHNMLITTAFEFPDYTLTKHVGIVHNAELVHGLTADAAADSVVEIQMILCQQLFKQAEELGGNAVIGLHYQFTPYPHPKISLAGYLMAYGTAVVVKKK